MEEEEGSLPICQPDDRSFTRTMHHHTSGALSRPCMVYPTPSLNLLRGGSLRVCVCRGGGGSIGSIGG